MCRIWLMALVSASCCVTAEARAGGLIQELPQDGSWVKYHLVQTQTREGGGLDERSASVTISSVGQTVVNGQPCRWIEIYCPEYPLAERKPRTIGKVLVPEAHLGRGRQTSEHALRGWEQVDDYVEEIRKEELRSMRGLGLTSFLLFSPDALVPPQPLKKPRTIKYQDGELTCGGIKGAGETALGDSGAAEVTYRIWTHKNVPFGVAAMTVEFRKDGNDAEVTTHEFVLTDFGTGAKTKLSMQN